MAFKLSLISRSPVDGTEKGATVLGKIFQVNDIIKFLQDTSLAGTGETMDHDEAGVKPVQTFENIMPVFFIPAFKLMGVITKLLKKIYN